ncbi:hypothetical protein EC988_008405, partial [Linderina pennispora]
DILPPVPLSACAFAYRPYTASGAARALRRDSGSSEGVHGGQGWAMGEGGSDDDGEAPCVRVVRRQTSSGEDRERMAKLHSRAICARLSEAKRLVDDARFEYACDVVFECQRG